MPPKGRLEVVVKTALTPEVSWWCILNWNLLRWRLRGDSEMGGPRSRGAEKHFNKETKLFAVTSCQVETRQ